MGSLLLGRGHLGACGREGLVECPERKDGGRSPFQNLLVLVVEHPFRVLLDVLQHRQQVGQVLGDWLLCCDQLVVPALQPIKRA